MKNKIFLTLLPFTVMLFYAIWSFVKSLDSQKTWKIVASATAILIFLLLGIIVFVRILKKEN